MKLPTEQQAIEQISSLLGEHLTSSAKVVSSDGSYPLDGVVQVSSWTFLVEWKGGGRPSAVAGAIEQLKRHAPNNEGIPLLAVAHMSKSGRKLCKDAGMSWLDLSGNADIRGPGLRVHVQGHPNRFRGPGRPSNVFAAKSARITRWLLLDPSQSFTQRELAAATGVGEGFTSRIVRRLEQDHLLLRGESGAIQPRNPSLLLEAWREAYKFSHHQILRGHMASRSGAGLVRRLAEALRQEGIDYAATGLASAWLWTQFSGFRMATFYLRQLPSPEMLNDIGFQQGNRGANTWLVTPDDVGVFDGQCERDGVTCVSAVQTYLDLKGHPERAVEAAEVMGDWVRNSWGTLS